MSKKGCKILKVKDDKVIKIEASKSLERIMNKYVEKSFDDYEIDTLYYLREIRKEITKIEPATQTQLLL
jgi:hypothetical protein